MTRPINYFCPYCGKVAVMVTGKRLYPDREDLYRRKFLRCEPCDAHVGIDPITKYPLGFLADARTRRARMKAHKAFDPIWEKTPFTRTQAYRWLAEKLDMTADECHIARFDVETCKKVVEICERRMNK